MIAALYIDPRGPYPKLEDVDAWDAARDARLYEGPYPVVAHPPCGPWSSLKHLSKMGVIEHAMAPGAVSTVRRFGGVLEHPATSKLWDWCKLPKPGAPADSFGFSIEVDQCDWGHVARKTTWLYICGLRGELPPMPAPREPTHWCSGSRGATRSDGSPRSGSPVPPGIKVCSAAQRRRTPPAFALWLLELARQCGPVLAFAHAVRD